MWERVEQNNPAAVIVRDACRNIFLTENPWKKFTRKLRRKRRFIFGSLLQLSRFSSIHSVPPPPLLLFSVRKGRHAVYLLNIKSENINSRKCRSRCFSPVYVGQKRISDCKMWEAREELSPGNLWRRFEQNEERNEPLFPPERPGVERGRSGRGGGEGREGGERGWRCKRRAFPWM